MANQSIENFITNYMSIESNDVIVESIQLLRDVADYYDSIPSDQIIKTDGGSSSTLAINASIGPATTELANNTMGLFQLSMPEPGQNGLDRMPVEELEAIGKSTFIIYEYRKYKRPFYQKASRRAEWLSAYLSTHPPVCSPRGRHIAQLCANTPRFHAPIGYPAAAIPCPAFQTTSLYFVE